ncbi:MAG: phosphatidate cytidylyltransferase, partial [Bradyrhizobium sp.]|nr:phosphatidate cytidylyltransferase [Bradyrhizobium sp.]
MTAEKAAPVAARPGQSNLVTRVASAIVLVPLAIAAAYAGGWYWAALVT